MPRAYDATGMKNVLIYHAPELVPLRGEVERHSIGSRLKEAMVAESSLIASKLGYFLPALTVGLVGTAEIAANPQSWEDISLKVVLMLAVLFLVRVIAKKDEKIEVLYERLAEKEDEDEDGPGPQRHRKKRVD